MKFLTFQVLIVRVSIFQMTKKGYADCLRELENISEEIHARRRERDKLGVREPGVGTENPPPSPKRVPKSDEVVDDDEKTFEESQKKTNEEETTITIEEKSGEN